MNRLLAASLGLLFFIGIAFLPFSGGAGALLLVFVMSMVAIGIFNQFGEEKRFITILFLGGLATRLAFGLFVHALDLRDFFGGDANTYDFFGQQLLLRWTDSASVRDPFIEYRLDNPGSGWGMYDIVAAIYYLLGQNILAAQSFCAVVGACIAPMVYFCAQRMFQNNRVARVSALLAAFFPAFVIWSGQLLKDGLLVFLLVLAMTMVLELQRRFSWPALILLVAAVAGVLPLRFYIFYMLAPAIVGSFLIGSAGSAKSMFQGIVVLIVLGLGLTYIGATRYAGETVEVYGSLETIQNSRMDLSRSAQSGFGGDADVSTTGGALTTIPIGLTYLLLAPFPWQMASVRSAITAPEVFVWWGLLPLMVAGIAWTVRHNLRRALPVLLFSVMLTLAYSITQGNVGTAYRQRTQIQVFLFIFIAVGWTVRKEKQENDKILAMARRQHMQARLQETRAGALHT